ncbi:PGN_0703 family putative restriction endonuclease [Sinorhizobium fredii]|uniref:PGN_0703 family putative restriction endonuclease n=1 Tax=Rhizobium fredii TaxID=380 RepID=UPI0035194390
MADDLTPVRENLFPASHAAIGDWLIFPWHRDRANRIQAHKAHSSQAIAIDVFGTLKMSTDRDRVLDAIAQHVGVAPGGPWSVTLEWTDKDRLLGEPRPTQVDAFAVGSMAALVIECKFTEPGGKCSQTAGSRTGKPQCNGSYTEQVNPSNGVCSRCALAGKGIRYWDYIPKVFTLDPAADHAPCPFAGDAYQWMRNAVLAAAIGENRKLQAAAVAAFADHPNFPTARKAKLGLIDPRHCSSKAAVRPVSYQEIINIARQVGLDQELWNDLSGWITQKIARASSRRLAASSPLD